MAIIHFLNVKEGDCSIIQHNSDRVSVIDVCNAYPTDLTKQKSESGQIGNSNLKVSINSQQKNYPVNPVAYLSDHGISYIFRYIQTHPDMDHMDGIKALFDRFCPTNFWDTANKKKMSDSLWTRSPYNQSDWKFYKKLQNTNPSNPKRLTLLAGAKGKYWNKNNDGMTGGDGLYILAPTQELVNTANNNDDYNDCSYVLLYRTGGKRIIFSGDSHDKTWNYILEKYKNEVTNIDLLIAPHHGRDSERTYDFLDVLKPTLTFFGYARSEHLAYNAWSKRKLPIITSNQANCMIVDASETPMKLYVTNKAYAKAENPHTCYNKRLDAWSINFIKRPYRYLA